MAGMAFASSSSAGGMAMPLPPAAFLSRPLPVPLQYTPHISARSDLQLAATACLCSYLRRAWRVVRHARYAHLAQHLPVIYSRYFPFYATLYHHHLPACPFIHAAHALLPCHAARSIACLWNPLLPAHTFTFLLPSYPTPPYFLRCHHHHYMPPHSPHHACLATPCHACRALPCRCVTVYHHTTTCLPRLPPAPRAGCWLDSWTVGQDGLCCLWCGDDTL